MQKDLGDYRRTYQKSELSEATAPGHPMQLFRLWFGELEASGGPEEPNAMTVSTLGLDGYPKSRVVLLKRFSGDGFEFYTNYRSEKGQAIARDPRVCLSFYWPVMERQVIVKGDAVRMPENLSDGYFESRPEGSKLGAHASPQSEVVPSRSYLDDRLAELEREFGGREIPRPAHWGGYRVVPVSVEFWQGRPNRMHDRLRYRLDGAGDWKLERLAP